MNDRLSIEEYFKYHPPLTEKRKAIHNSINESALEFAKRATYAEDFEDVLRANVIDPSTLQMAIASLKIADRLRDGGSFESAILQLPFLLKGVSREELFLFFVQQARMFANQGATIDELRLLEPPKAIDIADSVTYQST
jgi:hypothetical protein